MCIVGITSKYVDLVENEAKRWSQPVDTGTARRCVPRYLCRIAAAKRGCLACYMVGVWCVRFLVTRMVLSMGRSTEHWRETGRHSRYSDTICTIPIHVDMTTRKSNTDYVGIACRMEHGRGDHRRAGTRRGKHRYHSQPRHQAVGTCHTPQLHEIATAKRACLACYMVGVQCVQFLITLSILLIGRSTEHPRATGTHFVNCDINRTMTIHVDMTTRNSTPDYVGSAYCSITAQSVHVRMRTASVYQS